MSTITPIFELSLIGSGTTATKDDWYDLSGAIASNSQFWTGFATFISWDKSLTFELRSNNSGQSTGTVGTTQLKAFTSVGQSDSKDVDLYLSGNIITLVPVVPSTGVEKLWLRVRGSSNTISTFDYILHYTSY